MRVSWPLSAETTYILHPFHNKLFTFILSCVVNKRQRISGPGFTFKPAVLTGASSPSCLGLPRPTHLGCFIQPSRCTCTPASLPCSCPGELPLSRPWPSERCMAQSVGRPHVAARHGEHLGWQRAWHSGREMRAMGERWHTSLLLLSPHIWNGRILFTNS